MNNLIPPELQDLAQSKQRVLRNVVNEIEQHSTKSKHPWRFAMIATLLTLCALTFVLKIVEMEDEPTAIEQHVDFGKPTLSEESGVFYLQGLTIGDSQSKVIEQFGEDFTIVQEEANESDLIMDYDGKLRVYLEGDVVSKITFLNVDRAYFNKHFNDFDGFKFFLSMPTVYDGRYIYYQETDQIVYASSGFIDGHPQLSLFNPGQDLREHAEFLFAMDLKIKHENATPTDHTIDFKKPTFSEKDGYLYLQGITYGDSFSKVIEQLGENYLIGYYEGAEWTPDFAISYEDQVTVSFEREKVDSISLQNIDKEYFKELFASYNGLKLIDRYGENRDRYIYSKDPGLLLKATTNTPNEELYLYLIPVGKNLLDDPDFPGVEVAD